MRDRTVFDAYLLYRVTRDDVEDQKPLPFAVSLAGIDRVASLSPNAAEILEFLVAASNRMGCFVGLDLDCPLWSTQAKARFELREKGFVSFHSGPHGRHLCFTESFQQLLLPEPEIVSEIFSGPVTKTSPAPHAE